MENYRTHSTSKFSALLLDPVVIEETKTTRKVLKVDLNDKKIESGETVGITIIHQRKKGEEWQDVQSISLSSLKGGESVKLDLDSQTTKKLYEKLGKLYSLVAQQGVQYGNRIFNISKADEIIKVSKDRKLIIESLLKENYAEEVWKGLVDTNPNLATKLSMAKVQTNRLKAFDVFAENLAKKNSDEGFWQKFFSANSWIFGYGLNYQFLDIITDQPNYGGSNFTGKGAERGDYLMRTNGIANFTVLVEIKTPSTNLLSFNKNKNKQLRNNVWLLSGELLGAVSQIQVNTKTWDRNSQSKDNFKALESQRIYSVLPKSILIIGSISEFENDESKLNCFELFRRNLNQPEIMTFDELYERARFIVNNDLPERKLAKIL